MNIQTLRNYEVEHKTKKPPSETEGGEWKSKVGTPFKGVTTIATLLHVENHQVIDDRRTFLTDNMNVYFQNHLSSTPAFINRLNTTSGVEQ